MPNWGRADTTVPSVGCASAWDARWSRFRLAPMSGPGGDRGAWATWRRWIGIASGGRTDLGQSG